MATPANDDLELEEGEIVSDGESKPNDPPNEAPPDNNAKNESPIQHAEIIRTKTHNNKRLSNKRRKRVNAKLNEPPKKPPFQHPNEREQARTHPFNKTNVPEPYDDDFAGNVERAIKKILYKDLDVVSPTKGKSDGEKEQEGDKKKHKKRKRREESGDRDKKKKHKSNTSKEDVDESEMMCIRGASPSRVLPKHTDKPWKEEDESNDSDGSIGYQKPKRSNRSRRRGGMFGNRDAWFDRGRQKFDHRRNGRSNFETDELCLFYLQGKCYKGDSCIYSHSVQPPRKMELCKFYLMDCCAKRDKCLYMHSDFPCKYYHTGLQCIYQDDCKFAHGEPLSDDYKQLLLKHLESAPKEILGDFPKWSRLTAATMINKAQMDLSSKYPSDSRDENMQSENEAPEHQSTNQYDRNKSSKTKQSRWCDEPSNNQDNILSLQNLNGVLSAAQITKLEQFGVKNLSQLNELTVGQLNQLGITISQISEIQLNTMNIEKLGLLNAPSAVDSNPYTRELKNQDLDMRVSPVIPDITKTVQSDSLGKDVDMRFEPSSDKIAASQDNKSLDIDQYTKDALKFSSHEKQDNSIREKDVDHRILNYVRDASIANVSVIENTECANIESDTDIRYQMPPLKQDVIQNKPVNEILRRMTTDDEEDGSLEIDEKWGVSDEDKPNEDSSPNHQSATVESSPSRSPKLDSSLKSSVADEVSKLMQTIKSSVKTETETKKDFKSRDPRNMARKSPERRSSADNSPKLSSFRREHVSIYDCVEGGTSERKRPDVDLRQNKDLDYRVTQFGDTDLRQTPGGLDVDLRLAFKPLTTTVEIDGSIDSHPPMTYKVYAIDIPKPDYTDIKNSTKQSEAAADPRLRKLFRLSIDENLSDSDKFKLSGISMDPRKRSKDAIPEKPKPLDLQMVAHSSNWYKDLSSNQKILVNQQLATVASSLKIFHQDSNPNKIFDLSEIHSNSMLLGILSNLCIMLNEKGEVVQTPEKNPVFMTPGFNPDMFNNKNMPLPMDGNNMGMMNPNMNMNYMPQMSNSDPRFMQNDPRAGPAMMGMPQPSISQGFDNSNFGNNFNLPDNSNFDNMNYEEYDDNYDDAFYSNQNNDYYKKSFRRGDNRRGRGMRGRDRRGNWKKERR